MTLRIIDISSFQAGLNPAAVDADGVVVKVSQGNYYTNPTWRVQADQTLAAGKVLGLYHFVDSNSGLKQEVDYFVNQVQDYVGKAVLVLDWENDASTGTNVADVSYAKAWLDRVAEKTGVEPLIYMSKGTTRSADWSAVAPIYGLWVAQYGSNNPMGWTEDFWTDNGGIGAFKDVVMQQYTSNGQIAGYNGFLDLDIFYGNRNAWMAYAASNGNVQPAPEPQPAPAVDNGRVGQTVKVGSWATNWATGEAIPDFVKGGSYEVVQDNGDRVLLGGVMSWLLNQDIDTGKGNPNAQGTQYTVQSGDSLSAIAAHFNVDMWDIVRANGIADPNVINVGQVLTIPGNQSAQTYTVQSGDNLSSIAAKYGTTAAVLAVKNGIADANLIYPGQVLHI